MEDMGVFENGGGAFFGALIKREILLFWGSILWVPHEDIRVTSVFNIFSMVFVEERP